MAKFSRKGVTVVKFLDTVAAGVPTRTELDGGTDVTQRIAAIDGFSLENQEIETPNLADTFDSKIPGSDQAADSSITFYEDDTTSTLEADLAKGTVGWIVILAKGDVPAGKGMDIFPVRVASNSRAYTVDNEAAKFTVKFSITDRPTLDAAVPAST